VTNCTKYCFSPPHRTHRSLNSRLINIFKYIFKEQTSTSGAGI
jgi:hypothetical protein